MGQSVTIYTDGAARGNPGPGGYGAVLISGKHRKELSGGFDCTTNNRMEILAAVEALEALNRPCEIVLFSDSRYVIDAMSKGWMRSWKANGWKRKPNLHLKNADLWKRMDSAAEPHEVTWKWVKGHAGNPENERCDELATAAADSEDRPADKGFLQEED